MCNNCRLGNLTFHAALIGPDEPFVVEMPVKARARQQIAGAVFKMAQNRANKATPTLA